ncbi:MAG: hypothetical protein L3K26_13270 [Candidatus Hydrogenedentes bacterium]|nr:hypothetical protein [Candidatus Hydrogenedentota bacterium]
MTCGSTSKSQSARPRLFQALAVFFVVLYALSAVRGLVPGLCLNLTAAEGGATGFGNLPAIQVGAATCCTTLRKAEEGDGNSQPFAPKRCPFCRLAFGMTETPVFVYFEPLAPTGFRPGFAPPAEGVTQRIDRAQAGRGPPQIANV